jgi:hypothetical protein
MRSSDGSAVCGALREVFPAKTSASPAAARASQENAHDCGPTCGGLFGCSDPLGHSLRTFLRSELAALTGCSLTWKNLGTPARRSWWVLTTLERPTDESGFGSCAGTWVTPSRCEPGINPERIVDKDGNPPAHLNQRLYDRHTGRMVQDGLRQQIAISAAWPTVHGNGGNNGPTGTELGRAVTRGEAASTAKGSAATGSAWPTPTASESANRETKTSPSHGVTRGSNLAGVVGDVTGWATPNQRDWKDTGPTQGARKSPNLGTQAHIGQQAQADPSTDGSARGSLSPDWVAQLMIGACGERWLDGVKPR